MAARNEGKVAATGVEHYEPVISGGARDVDDFTYSGSTWRGWNQTPGTGGSNVSWLGRMPGGRGRRSVSRKRNGELRQPERDPEALRLPS